MSNVKQLKQVYFPFLLYYNCGDACAIEIKNNLGIIFWKKSDSILFYSTRGQENMHLIYSGVFRYVDYYI